MSGLLISCRCGARHNPRIRWTYGRYVGTSAVFQPRGSIPAGHCPVCLRQPINTDRIPSEQSA